ncbi:MAG: chromosome segregation protein [Aliidongia sp.]|nr:chromosome segregation protein [Aliidongia sp.]
MRFTRLRLTGFKSFTDSTELLIEPGLTGIVGPNGCGKSNLVEALQWAMGESSARRLRGGDMDDVIFGGTTTRPARNIASVTLSLDNRERQVLSALDDSDEIEIERRIERGKGSTYRVNGREQRARDVQLLFADAASGAHSTALIGQGRIGWLINARPTERRLLLEEAANISGLQARRHEAELRLSAAETNLVRLGDIAQSLTAQIERLKKQARQAERYRRVAEQIRLAEALLLYRHWLDRSARLTEAAARLVETEERVAATLAASENAHATRDAAQAALPPLRDAAAETAAAVEKLSGTLHLIEAEEKRLAQLIEDSRRRLSHLDQDLARERLLTSEAETAMARLKAESIDIESRLDAETSETGAATEHAAAAQAAVTVAETTLSETTARNATMLAERNALVRRRTGLDERRLRLRRQLAEADSKLRELDLLSVSDAHLAEAAQSVTAAEAALAAGRDAADAAALKTRSAQVADQAASVPVQEIDRRGIKLRAEIDALKSVAAAGVTRGFAPVLDRIAVTPGLETALGAALGDDLLAALDSAAPSHWAALPPETEPPEPLPEGIEALARSVEAPAPLARRLARIGIVGDGASGTRLQAALRPGQSLVTRDGAAWRWDGLCLAAGAPTAAAVRLAQRNRLHALEGERGALEHEAAAAQATRRDAAASLQAAQQGERAAQAALQQTVPALAAARQAQTALTQRHAQSQLRHQAAEDAATRLRQELAEADAQATDIEREAAALPDPAADQQLLVQLRTDLAQLRERESLHRRHVDRLARDAAAGRARLGAIKVEGEAWQRRTANAEQHCTALTERRDAALAEAAALAERPQMLAAEKSTLLTGIATARAAADAAGTALRAAEVLAAETDRAHQAAAARHGEARERRVRAEADHEQTVEARLAASSRARGTFDCPAEHLPRVAGIPAEPGDEPIVDLEARFERLTRERDSIGPVNLTAESEMAQLDREHATIVTESADLVAAIAKLRQAIQQLNREGAERLKQAFDVVNSHFQDLFVRLFGGGRAYLELTGNEADPFAGGLEIMASPPGKKLQMLSLLSGGERALTALALVFAVFLTNPAPISVLDEVDAPLDDANVERFCHLVREIGQRTGTRFLIITHHRVTMAVMDRLYGVTMIEKGVSQLVSVELASAENLRRTA